MRYVIAAAFVGAGLVQSVSAAPMQPGAGASRHLRATGLVDNDTYHSDALRTGWNDNESALNTSTVASSSFGKLFSVKMDGLTHMQPLIAAGESIPSQGVHDLLIAGTNRDRLYAYDANTGAAIWQVNFAGHGANYVPINYTYCNNTGNSDGILSTPVIDRVTDSLYVVAATLEGKKSQKSMHYRLHHLQLATGQEEAGSPVDIQATYTWAGPPIAFNPNVQFQRGALLEWMPPPGTSGNPQIDIAFGSQCDYNGNQYHGWVMAYDAYTLAQTAVQNVTPAQDSYGNYYGGIWMSGNGPAEDAGGSVYFSVGNGTFDGTTSFGESILKLPANFSEQASAGFQYFTPYTVYQDNAYDADTGSGGIMLLPDQGGSYPHVMVMQGKDGVFTLLNRDNMGGFVPYGPDKALAELYLGSTWSSPAYYHDAGGNSYVYTTGGPLYRVQIAGASATVTSASNVGFPSTNGNGSTPTISSFQGQAGSAIAWIVQRPGYPQTAPLELYAFDASDLTHVLYEYKLGRWAFPASNPTLVPTVANGKVYVANANSIVVFGLH